MQDTEAAKKAGYAIHNEIRNILTGSRMGAALHSLYNGAAGIELRDFIPSYISQAILSDLAGDSGWNTEAWKLCPDGDVTSIAPDSFEKLPEENKFSFNQCLRKPSTESFALRGFLSALTHTSVSDFFSHCFQQQIKFKSVDIAKYSKGDFLRRHADLFEDRRFGLVWFFGDGWVLGNGGELVIEANSGRSVAIPPIQGTVAALLIKPDYFHHVTENRSAEWVRFSAASHYHQHHIGQY